MIEAILGAVYFDGSVKAVMQVMQRMELLQSERNGSDDGKHSLGQWTSMGWECKGGHAGDADHRTCTKKLRVPCNLSCHSDGRAKELCWLWVIYVQFKVLDLYNV